MLDELDVIQLKALKRLCDLCVGLKAEYTIAAMADELGVSEKEAKQLFGILAGRGYVVRRRMGVWPTKRGYDRIQKVPK